MSYEETEDHMKSEGKKKKKGVKEVLGVKEREKRCEIDRKAGILFADKTNEKRRRIRKL